MSVRALPSILTKRWWRMDLTSSLERAYFKRFLSKIVNGNDSRSLCGPAEGRGAY